MISNAGSRNMLQRLSFNTLKQRKVNVGEKLGEAQRGGRQRVSESCLHEKAWDIPRPHKEDGLVLS